MKTFERLVSRMRRAWVRLAAVVVVTSAVGAGAVAVLLREEAAFVPTGPVAVSPGPSVATVPAPAPVAPAAVPPRTPPPLPTSVGEVDRASRADDLAAWVTDTKLAPTLRYAALRRLEALSPADAESAAVVCLRDVVPLVRLNAIAVLTRAGSATARSELERVDPRSQQLARALAVRR